jgi:predicted MPP superfamily phosphohydrolase
MFFFIPILTALLAALNYFLYRSAIKRLESQAPGWRWIAPVWFGVINSPALFIFAVYLSGHTLNQIPLELLKWLVYPFFAWVATLLAFLLVGAPAELLMAIWRGLAWGVNRLRGRERVNLARRGFLTSAAAFVPPLLYGISIKGVYGPHDLDISPVQTVAIPGLPASFDGMMITQISDLHTGAYIRQPELDHVVEAANRLRGDLIAVTGDFMDSSTTQLDVARQSLARLRAPLGVFGILGNHDYYADRAGPHYPGCLAIMGAMQEAGIRMLRNAHCEIRAGAGRFILGGVDWTGNSRGNPNYYDSPRTRQALAATFQGSEAGVARILMAHHPHVFFDSPSYDVALTLAGHTHGGGQVVVAEVHGQPITMGTAVFHFVSGVYREGSHTLYVNRGIGYVGLPIRLNCPPEISRFKLVRG